MTFAFSLFWLTDADICSIDAEDSSTAAACSELLCDRDCAVALTSSEAEESESAALRTLPMMPERRSTMFRMLCSSSPVSSLASVSIRTLRSPLARRSATSTATPRGFVMLRVIHSAVPKASSRAPSPSPIITVRAVA